MRKRLLLVGSARIANRVSLGDAHDLSIEYLIQNQPDASGFLLMRLPAGTFEVTPVIGEESIAENERKADGTAEPKPAGKSTGKSKPGK